MHHSATSPPRSRPYKVPTSSKVRQHNKSTRTNTKHTNKTHRGALHTNHSITTLRAGGSIERKIRPPAGRGGYRCVSKHKKKHARLVCVRRQVNQKLLSNVYVRAIHYRTRPPATIVDVHGPAEVCMGRPFHPATPSSAVFIPSIVADHAREAAPLGGAGAERTPSNVTSSPTLAPSGGDKGSTLFSRGGGGGIEYWRNAERRGGPRVAEEEGSCLTGQQVLHRTRSHISLRSREGKKRGSDVVRSLLLGLSLSLSLRCRAFPPLLATQP